MIFQHLGFIIHQPLKIVCSILCPKIFPHYGYAFSLGFLSDFLSLQPWSTWKWVWSFLITTDNEFTQVFWLLKEVSEKKKSWLTNLTLHCCSVWMRFLLLVAGVPPPPPPCACGGCLLPLQYDNDCITVSVANKIIWRLIRLVFIHFLQQLSMFFIVFVRQAK